MIPTKKRETDKRKERYQVGGLGGFVKSAQGMADQRQQAAASCQGQWPGGGAGPSPGMGGARLHLPHGWIGSRSTGWEEQRGLPREWPGRDSKWGEEQDLPHGWLGRYILQPQNMKRNKTAEEPKKHNSGARKRVALDRGGTIPNFHGTGRFLM
jgi:hypothetical protein